ncbi:hypothetical protein Hdeb2414_s0010g00331881 [Helianthus debilis subsp. tardiflorus]
MTMQTKLNTFNGLYHQADRLHPSGSDDAFVTKQSLKDYKSKEKIDFGHIAVWEIVRINQSGRRYLCWVKKAPARVKKESLQIREIIERIHQMSKSRADSVFTT